MKKRKQKKPIWFKPVRWSYLPVRWQGWLLYVPYITFLLFTFIIVRNDTGTPADTMLGIIPYWLSATVIMHWVAAHTSK